MMSSLTFDYGEPRNRSLRSACDICHRRKIRCNIVAHGRCSICIELDVPCTRSERGTYGLKTRHDAENEALKRKVSILEAKLRQANLSLVPPATHHSAPVPSDTSASSKTPPEDSKSAAEALTERFNTFSLGFDNHRFFGPSSGYMLMKSALAAKEECIGWPLSTEWKRPGFWDRWPWEQGSVEDPGYVFPDSDLIISLVELYFINVHPMFPLLHRPSFERSMGEDLHFSNSQFGATLLAVLALASRYSDDPRVLAPGTNSPLSSGWPFFNQIRVINRSFHDLPSIYEVQLYCLVSLFVQGTSSPQAAWAYLALGIRFVQERGGHRRRRGGHSTLEGELWNRAFWCLLCSDTAVCAFLGRPPAIHIEDYDVEPPLDVDDEYILEYADSERAFTQPAGKPSMLSFFVHQTRLCEILSSALRLLYASKKSKKFMGWVGSEWEQRVVADLDSAMNQFLNSLPEHLRWDGDGDDSRLSVFFDQSAMLHTMFYQLQITIHRPYINAPAVLPFPSLSICTRAARASINVLDVWLKRRQRVVLAPMLSASLISSLVLLFNVFGAARAKLAIDVEKELAQVTIAMRALNFFGTRYQLAGRCWELVNALCSQDRSPSNIIKAGMPIGETAAVLNGSQNTQPGNEMIVPQRDPAVNVAGEMFPPSSTFGKSSLDMSLEDLLSGAGFPDQTGAMDGSGSSHVGSNDNVPSKFANSTQVDDEVMSMWTAAPTAFGNLDEWDSYMSMENLLGFGWSADLGGQGTTPSTS
ncbi:fungal-specific transcription factor domain-containing protein [Mycena crocata]|nr:fungal-specific transcription factor domain-containing protein [Mycena crocata]